MIGAVSIDGVLVPADRATVSVFDRGFLYGDAALESMRAYAGRAFACAEHLARLARSVEILGFALPVSPRQISAEIGEALAASALGEAFVRVVVTRGASADPGLLAPSRPTRIVLVTAPNLPPRDVYLRGLRAITSSRVSLDGPLAGAKLPFFAPSVVALQGARARNAEEVIFLAPDGAVADATSSNVVVVTKTGGLMTPRDGPGVLGGITREHVLELACAMGVSCSLQAVRTDDLLGAREVFLTSSLREIASVVSIDGHAIGDGVPGETTRALHRAYRLRAGALGPAPWE